METDTKLLIVPNRNLTYSFRKESRKQTLSKYNDISRIILDQQYDPSNNTVNGRFKTYKNLEL